MQFMHGLFEQNEFPKNKTASMERYDIFHPHLMFNLFRWEEFFAKNTPAEVIETRGDETEEEFFQNFVGYNFNEIAKEYDCRILINPQRTTDAYHFWKEDLVRVLDKMPEKTEQLDEFKRAGFLSFWLRRRVIVDDITPNDFSIEDGFRYEEHVADFIEYGNEIASFILGHKFCLRFRLTGKRNPSEFQRQIELYQLNSKFIKDTAVYLKNKEVSPHSIYLIYKAIFRFVEDEEGY